MIFRFSVLGLVCLSVLASPAVAQQSRYSDGWSDPSAPRPQRPAADSKVDRMVRELNQLVDEADRARRRPPLPVRSSRSRPALWLAMAQAHPVRRFPRW